MLEENNLLRRLKKILPQNVIDRFLVGIRKAIEKKGDLSLVYHEVSKLDFDYYGVDLPYSRPSQFWKEYGGECIELPKPQEKSGVDVFEAIRTRRSRREYTSKPLSLEQVSAILYYTVGVTGRAWWGGPKRAYPSAGGLQPVEAYLYASNVEGLERGLYHYHPGRHCLEVVKLGDYSKKLMRASLDQDHVGEAPVVLILTVVYSRTASKYGLRSYRYIHWDSGFAGQNVYLAVEALGLATVTVGAFYDEEVCRVMEIDCVEEIPMLIFPIGYRA